MDGGNCGDPGVTLETLQGPTCDREGSGYSRVSRESWGNLGRRNQSAENSHHTQHTAPGRMGETRSPHLPVDFEPWDFRFATMKKESFFFPQFFCPSSLIAEITCIYYAFLSALLYSLDWLLTHNWLALNGEPLASASQVQRPQAQHKQCTWLGMSS